MEELSTSYAGMHRARFEYCVGRIAQRLPCGSRILDVGSHFLDQAVILKERGYDVWGMDAPAFADDPRVVRIAGQKGIRLLVAGEMASGRFAPEIADSHFDAMVMTEVIEHLAFNPLPMWKRLFELLRPGGWIFLSTPNGMGLERRVVDMARILLGRGRGEPVGGIFEQVTFGHHWKEYGPRELLEYFGRLGIPGDHLEMSIYSYGRLKSRGLRGTLRRWLGAAGNLLPGLGEELFVAARLPDPKPSVPPPPDYFTAP